MTTSVMTSVTSSAASAVVVTVPATTANMGPGFDCLGAALSIYNRFEFTVAGADQPLSIQVLGDEADRVTCDDRNLVFQAFQAFYQRLGQALPPLSLTIDLAVPLARGLGSSSTAIVAGLMGANGLAGAPLSRQALVDLAIEIEGHPDNVVPAMLGGCRLAARNEQAGGEWVICDMPWPDSVVPVVVIPDFELSTAAARQVLPPHYSQADAIFNAAHLGLLVQGLSANRQDWIRAALCDRIHQPYRQTLIPGYDTLHRAALDSGALGLVISGAGPTLLCLTPSDQTESVQQGLRQALSQIPAGHNWDIKPLTIDSQGARLEIKTS